MNESEFQKYSMIEHYGAARKFYNIGTLVITRASKGPIIITENDVYQLEGINKEVADVTGAGDVFIAAMTYYLAKGEHIQEACDKANKLASLSVGHFGTYTLTEDDIRTIEKKVVFTNGCFDIIHRGHIDYLQKSKKLGSKLIVGLNSDESVARLKGTVRPHNKQEDRKKVLEALNCVDEVIIFNGDTPYELIKDLKPDIITKGGDYKTIEEVVGNDLAEVIIIPFTEGYSTTKTLENLNADC
jgi:D-beta-D-heptose 7-phosphate kinase/D-beta-D-heptose 1-phosphate adenosyltransferase